MIKVWQQRAETLGIIVSDVSGTPVFEETGDSIHRFVTRTHTMPMIVPFSVNTPIRPVVAMLALGRKVACCILDDDDVNHVARRLYTYAPGHLSEIPVAVWSGEKWSSHRLVELI